MLAEPLPASAALREATHRARRLDRPVLLSTTRRVGSLDPLTLFGQARERRRFLWLQPDADEALVGLGAAQVIAVSGEDRFARSHQAWAELLADAVIEDAGSPVGAPLLLGGFRFDPLRPPTGLWAGFLDDQLVLPARMLARRRGANWLTTNRLVGGPPRPASVGPFRPGPPASGLAPAEWQTQVRIVADGIRRGRFGLDKVVLARAQRAHVCQPVDLAAVAGRLAAGYPTCTVFAIVHGQSCFVGATPERLVAVHAGLASTMALAGSKPRGSTEAEDGALAAALLADPKERAEHAVVVMALRERLDEVSTRVMADAEPSVRRLANVQHLSTHLRGALAPGRTILDVVARLHPTPAVGGYPSEAALRLIRERERLDRGWYGGPIGWLDRQGQGEFVVGIRSALVRGQEAVLFAGCGIVGDSEPATELAESRWKLRPMLSALDSPLAS
ncbi:MAG: isochorismate synthase [Chloroflexota bacterium]|nr:isochorismate synthase [Chloroflexota bacterium]